MEIFDRTKAILFNPKEEWTVIEAENEPHTNVLFKYLLILALIPTLAYFAGEYLGNRSSLNDYKEKGIEQIENSYKSRLNSYNSNPDYIAGLTKAKNEEIANFEKNAEESFLIMNPFSNLKWNIIFAVCLFGIILIGAYLSAAIINALSNQFGSEKNFNKAFSLVAYSFTPFCIGGILYAFHSFASFVPYIGLYGLYLLYLGIEPQMKPAMDKKSTALVISAVVFVGVWLLLARVAVPEIQKKIMAEEYISRDKKADPTLRIDDRTRGSYEKQAKLELENHKY